MQIETDIPAEQGERHEAQEWLLDKPRTIHLYMLDFKGLEIFKLKIISFSLRKSFNLYLIIF